MSRIVSMGGVAALLMFWGQVSASAAEPLEARMQAALDAVVASDATVFPGAILEISHPDRGTYAVASGVTDIETDTPLAPDARFRAGSVAKPFVAAVVLQLVEEGKLSLDDPMAKLLPEDIARLFPDSGGVTLKMLLDHTSGIPDWLSEEVIGRIAANPAKTWDVREFLEIAAAMPRAFAPGKGWAYSNTDYNLLGVIIARATGQSWREAVRTRVIEPLGLSATSLPEPGDATIPSPFMHGYGLIGGKVVDLSFVDPSMADAAGGGALVTTVGDLAAFLTALRAGKLFKDPATFSKMADFVAAEAEGGQVGYGLGLEKYVQPGGIEMIGHSGTTAGYRAGLYYFPASGTTLAFAISAAVDPTPVIAAALEAIGP